ncbi:MAG: hypothetical protein IKR41_11615 [Bacteroidales bacterium]|nr:hypothetical protein [Bacteroidales bacterium]
MKDNFFDNTETADSLFDDLATPLKRFEDDTTETDETPEDENSENDGLFEEDNADESPERIKRLNELGAKGIVKVLDIGVANLSSHLAYCDDVSRYRADEDALSDLTEVVSEAMPGKELKMPLWLQILIYALVAFVPVILLALADRRENKEVFEEKERIRKLEQQIKTLKLQNKKNELEDSLTNGKNADAEPDNGTRED